MSDGLLHYLITLFGAAVMYSFALNKGFDGAVNFLKHVFPNKGRYFYVRVDFFVVTISGSIIGTIFFTPNSSLEALAAGFGWVGAVNVLSSDKKRIDAIADEKLGENDA